MPNITGANDHNATSTATATGPAATHAPTAATVLSPGGIGAAPAQETPAQGYAQPQGGFAMSSPHLSQQKQGGQGPQRVSPMPGLDSARSSVPPLASSPASNVASTPSSAMTPIQQLTAQIPQNGGHTPSNSQGNGTHRAPSAAADDRGAKRIKTEHEQSSGGNQSPSMMPPGGYMGYPGGNMPMMMPGYGSQGSMPPNSMPQNGFPPGGYVPNPGMMPFPSNPGNGNGQYGYVPPHIQMQMMQGFQGGQGGMGPPMWMPNYGPMDPQQQQQMGGSSASTPMQAGDSADSTTKAPKQRKPRVKKEPGEKGKGKGKKGDEDGEEGNGQGEPGAVDMVLSNSQAQSAEGQPDSSPVANTPQEGDGETAPKVKGKRGPKGDKNKGDKIKKPRKKKDKGADGDITPGQAGTPGAGVGTPAAIPDEISVVQSLLASTVASSQLPAYNGDASSSAAAVQMPASNGEGAAPANGATMQPTAAAVQSSGDNVDALQDLLAGSGVDLQAEERAIQSGSTAQPSTSAAAAGAVIGSANPGEGQVSPFYLELYALSYRIHRAASKNGLRVEPEVLMYLSSAAKLRFRNLLEAMIAASRHRAWSSHTRSPPLYKRSNKPMYHEELLDDPQKLLTALTRVEKAEEQAARQRRMQRDEQAANEAAGIVPAEPEAPEPSNAANGLNSGTQTPSAAAGPSKKTGASAAARNMTEDKRLKLANSTAARALGIKSSASKSWMFSGGADSISKLPKKGAAGPSRLSNVDPKFPKPSETDADAEANGDKDGESATTPAPASANNPGGWGDLTARRRHREEEERRRARLVNLDDAMHALEMERSGGAGRGSGERALYMTRALGRPFLPPASSASKNVSAAAPAATAPSSSAPAPGPPSL